jgi:anhydro-N-acetylmuramic acid kinase
MATQRETPTATGIGRTPPALRTATAADESRRPPSRLIVGTMTGTSVDGLDVAVVEIEGQGLGMSARLRTIRSFPLGDLAGRLRHACEGTALSAGEFARLALDFGLLHAHRVQESLDGERPGLVVLHGQTVFHRPPVSWQLINPFPVAHAIGCPVAFDLRGADLAAGGQGAPITPLADWILFRGPRPRAIVNLGGFCNVTVLPGSHADSPRERIRGFDVCACNQVLDAAARVAIAESFDSGGRTAATGRVDQPSSAGLQELLARQRAAGRSLGSGDEAADWVQEAAKRLTGPDLLATAVAAVGTTIGKAAAEALRSVDPDSSGEIFLAGGGARNLTLAARIAAAAGLRCGDTSELGVPIEAREAMGIAVLGALAADREPTTLASVTGRGEPALIDALWCVPRRSDVG